MPAPPDIEEMPIPTGKDDPGWPDFVAVEALQSLIDAHVLQSNVFDRDPGESLAYFNAPYERHVHFVARDEGAIVGVARCSWSAADDASVIWIEGGVHPDLRNRGIGTTLFERAEAFARASGRQVIQVGATHLAGTGEMITAASGFGAVSTADPGVRFLRSRGYRLEQVERLSFLHLPIDPERLTTLRDEARARAGEQYRLHTWVGPTPEHWLDDAARIRGRLATDAPTGDLEVDELPWDAERVRAGEGQDAEVGRVRLVTSVEHVPSASLVAVTNLLWTADRSRPVRQGMTLVLKEHRGHRLGMLVKLANLEALQRHRPDATMVETDNAEENRPMLDVNEAIGFVPAGYMGAWKKILPDRGLG